jgi:ArsR family transcriptional regulator, arsenate/arsenite/antimonite-responsive transcriptional repressor
MEKSNAVAALAALAQDNRLDVYRLLVQARPDGELWAKVGDGMKG